MTNKNLFPLSLLLAFTFLIVLFKMASYDTWLHLNAGKYIVGHLSLPQYDPFSYTASQNRWVNQEWLSAVIFYCVHALFGFWGLTVFKGLIAVVTIFVCFKALSDRQINPYFAFWLLMISALMVRFRWTERPEIFTLFFLIFFQHQLQRFKEGKIRNLFLLPPLMVVWVNLHFAALIGIIMLAANLFIESLKYILHVTTPIFPARTFSREKLRHLVFVGLLCAGGLFLNPWTDAVFSFTREAYKLASIQETLEMLPAFSFPVSVFPLFWISLGVYVVLIIFVFQKMDLTDIMIFGLAALMAVKMIRLIPMYALISAMVMGPYFSYLAFSLSRFSKISMLFCQKGIMVLSAASIFLFLIGKPIGYLKNFQFGLGLHSEKHPVAAINFLKEHKISGNIFNDILFGGELTWERYPESKVFIDGRNLIFGEKGFKEYYQILYTSASWQAALDRYHVNVIFLGSKLATTTPLVFELSHNPDWALVYLDSLALVFIRSTATNAEFVNKFKYNLDVKAGPIHNSL